MNIQTEMRGKVVQALSDLKIDGVSIPVFDEQVNPQVSIPRVRGAAELYIVIQDQQSTTGSQSTCSVGEVTEMTVRVVSVFETVGSKKLCEDTGYAIEKLIRDERGATSLAGVHRVDVRLRRTQVELTAGRTSFSMILTFTFNLK